MTPPPLPPDPSDFRATNTIDRWENLIGSFLVPKSTNSHFWNTNPQIHIFGTQIHKFTFLEHKSTNSHFWNTNPQIHNFWNTNSQIHIFGTQIHKFTFLEHNLGPRPPPSLPFYAFPAVVGHGAGGLMNGEWQLYREERMAVRHEGAAHADAEPHERGPRGLTPAFHRRTSAERTPPPSPGPEVCSGKTWNFPKEKVIWALFWDTNFRVPDPQAPVPPPTPLPPARGGGGYLTLEGGTATPRYGIRFTRLLASGTDGPPKPHEPGEAPTRPAVGGTAGVSGRSASAYPYPYPLPGHFHPWNCRTLLQ